MKNFQSECKTRMFFTAIVREDRHVFPVSAAGFAVELTRSALIAL